MKNRRFATASALPLLARRMAVAAVLAGGVILAPAFAILASDGSATVSAHPNHRTGPDYWSITGVRVGAPSQLEVSTYGGSHKHLWVEQRLYGPDVVYVPHVDTTVHQSR
jgi:hypothetical protein